MAARKDLPGNHPGKPFLKWVGGKTQLLNEIFARIPPFKGRYFEPFLGGGAVFFALRPKRAVLCDANRELITTYTVVRDAVSDLIRELREYRYNEELYYKLRNADRTPDFMKWSPVRRAARFIYLNKSCYNGLYRVNSRGQHNVPFGRYSNPTILDEQTLRACSAALQGAELRTADFRELEPDIAPHDFVYFDPPYVPLSPTASFTGYHRSGFDLRAQEELADLCRRLSGKGVHLLLSNSATTTVKKLFRGFTIKKVYAHRAVNSVIGGRGMIAEYLVSNPIKGAEKKRRSISPPRATLRPLQRKEMANAPAPWRG